jgi:hypothetical protein
MEGMKIFCFLCVLACLPLLPVSAQSIKHSLTEPGSSTFTGKTKTGKPLRIKGRIQVDNEVAKGNSGNADATVATKAPEFDYDLYMRSEDYGIPTNMERGSPWQLYTERLLHDVHVLIERDLTVPGYADLLVTVKQDGTCTSEFGTLMGGPVFKEQALRLVSDLNEQRTLRYPNTNGQQSITLKIGAGAFHASDKEGHFWCGIGGEIPRAAAQLKARYSKYHE